MSITYFELDCGNEIPASSVSDYLSNKIPVGAIRRYEESAEIWVQDPNAENINKKTKVEISNALISDADLGYCLICKNFNKMKESKKPWT